VRLVGVDGRAESADEDVDAEAGDGEERTERRADQDDGERLNGRLIETCAASATNPAPPSTRRTLVSRLERGKTASRRVAASGLMRAGL
jgi:hypothetical protein